MKVGIDSYCYHRFFGEVYPDQKKPSKTMTLEDFIKRGKDLGVDGLSLESCFFPSFDAKYLADVKAMLDAYKLDRVFAWGHPDGLEGGKNETAFKDMMKSMEYAKAIGADTMRVVGSSLAFRFEDHSAQMKKLTKMFKEAAKQAEKLGLKIADENHIDFDSDEMISLIEAVGSPNFGINFDTGNFMRVSDDPVEGMKKLAKYTFATHVKDLKPMKGLSVKNWHFFATTPVGDGLVDNLTLAKLLKEADYQGFLAVEIDFLHPDYNDDEDAAVAKSVVELKRIAKLVG
jgi:sugar phosphate isomerase/epimerase